MKSSHQYLAPNIIAGTHFNVERFNELYRWIEAGRADALRIGAAGHGLLCDEHGDVGLDLKLSGDLLQLTKCTALTRQGTLIDIRPSLTGSLHLQITPADLNGQDRVDVVLICVPDGKRRATGTADPTEIPLRAPFSVPEVRLELHPPGTVPATADTLKIGELVQQDDAIHLADYLPACLENAAHPTLKEHQHKSVQYLTDFQQALILIVQNIDSTKEEVIVTRFADVCEQIGRFLATRMPVIKATRPHDNPRDLFTIYFALAELINFEWSIRKSYHSELSNLIRYNVKQSVVSFDINTVHELSQFRPMDDCMDEILHHIRELNEHFLLPIINVSKQSRVLVEFKRVGWDGEQKKVAPKPVKKENSWNW